MMCKGSKNKGRITRKRRSRSFLGKKKSDATDTKQAQLMDVKPCGEQKSAVDNFGREPPQPIEEGDKKCLHILLIGPLEVCNALCDLLKQWGRDNKEQIQNMAQYSSKEEDGKEGADELYFETDTTKCHLLMAQSYPEYMPCLVSKGLEVHIAMFVLPAQCGPEVNATIKNHAMFLSSLGIPKIIIVNNIEAEHYTNHPEVVVSLSSRTEPRTKKLLEQFNFDFRKIVSNVCISVEPPVNINSSPLEGLPCLFDILNSIELPPQCRQTIVRSCEAQSKWVEDLAYVDSFLDNGKKDSALWFERAKILRNLRFFCCALYACKTASDCKFDFSKKEEDALFYKMEGDDYYSKQKFDLAHEKYSQAKSILKQEIHQVCHDGQKALNQLQDLICDSLSRVTPVELMLKPNPKKDRSACKSLHLSPTIGLGQSTASYVPQEGDNESADNSVAQEAGNESVDNSVPQETGTIPQEAGSESSQSSVPQEANSINAPQEGNLSGKSYRRVELGTYIVLVGESLEDVYFGYKIFNGINYKQFVSVIPCTTHEEQDLENLMFFGSKCVNVVTILDIIYLSIGEDPPKKCFVVQPVNTFESYFTQMLKTFENERVMVGDEDLILIDWWNFIETCFKKIIREIIDGVLYLQSKGVTCEMSMYVTENGCGIVLPNQDQKAAEADIINGILNQMKTIVNLPCPSRKLPFEWLPPDLTHFFSFVSTKKLKCTPMWWLLDHHFVWSPRERIQFMYKLRRLLPYLYREYSIHEALNKYMCEPHMWFNQRRDDILWQIYIKGDINRPSLNLLEDDLNKAGWHRVKNYQDSSDIIRYMIAVFTHYNDWEYSALRKKELNIVEIEELLLDYFPKIHGILFDAIYKAIEIHKYGKDKDYEVLWELSRYQ